MQSILASHIRKAAVNKHMPMNAKRGMMVIMLLLAILPASFAISSCADYGGTICDGFQFCEGKTVLTSDNPYRNSCCIGTCSYTQSLACEEDEGIACIGTTSGAVTAKYKDISKPLLIYLLNPSLPNQPYPKMWNFWFRFALMAASVILILNI